MPFQPCRSRLSGDSFATVRVGKRRQCTGKLRCSACHYRAALAPGRAGRQNQLAVVAF
jgi:hypothetical protein